MAEGNASVAAWRFGRTMRRDVWWAAAARSCSSGSRRSSSTRPGRRSRARTTTSGRTSRRSTRPSSSATRRTPGSGRKPALVAGLAAVLAGAADPAGPRAASASPATTTAAPTTRRSGPTRRPARSASRASGYRGERSFPLILQNIHRYFLYLALRVPRRPRARRRGRRSGSPIRRPATTQFGIGVGTLVLRVNVVLLGGYTLGCHSLRHLVGGVHGPAVASRPLRKKRLRLRRAASTAATCSGPGCSLFSVGVRRPLRPPVRDGHLDRLEDPLMAEYQTHEHDVLVIGAGGAGLARGDRGLGRAACRSGWSASRCSARRTPSWPKAASRRRWPTSTTATTGRSTSPTPCAAASTSTTGAWPSCTPRKRRTACASSRPGARVFDRTTDGRILQRNFGGHRYPRLAHVGDRTGLEMIRTLQDHGIHQGIDVHMECTVVTPAQGRRPRRRRVRLRPRARPLPRVHAPRRSCSPPAASAARTRSPATAGSTPATATRSPTTPAPS